MRMVIQMFFVVAILLGLYFFFRSMRKPVGSSKFKMSSFNDKRKEVNKGELMQDPVSGTYVSDQEAITVHRDGKTYYFVNEENAAKFRKSPEDFL